MAAWSSPHAVVRNLQRPLRVLVADDDRETVETLDALLQAQGHVVHSVYNGKDVLPAARLFRPDDRGMSGVWKQFAERQVASKWASTTTS